MIKQNLMAIALVAGTLGLGACAEIPPCSSSDLDCNVGAYSEERTFRDNTGTTSNINKRPEPVIEAPAPAPVAEPAPVTEMPMTEPVPQPVEDTQIMQKADEAPAVKSLK